QKLEEVMRFIDKANLELVAIHVDESPTSGTKDLIIQVNTNDASKFIEDLIGRGYKVEVRERKI
ncbi:MAG: hypothetical protein PHV74_15995, partial [Dehalococcoidia bacterium]|nr:hypothetical protein [Dehalococcoidia bacterium]